MHNSFRITSLLLCVLIYQGVFYGLHVYDWGHGFTRFLLTSLLFGFAIILYQPDRLPDVSANIPRPLEAGLLLLMLGMVFCTIHAQAHCFGNPLQVDIGMITQAATKLLYLEGKNPYSSTIKLLYGNPDYAGMKYGRHDAGLFAGAGL